MKVYCRGCKRSISIPTDKLSVPNLRVRCVVCGAVFRVADATIALAAPVAPVGPHVPSAPGPVQAVESMSPSPEQCTAAVTTAAAVARVGAAGGPSAGSPPAKSNGARVHWRRCASHPGTAAESVCPSCKKGYCRKCGTAVHGAVVCPSCDALCASLADHEQRELTALRRARPIGAELPAILRYPLVDPVAFVMLSAFVWVFALAASVAAFGGSIGTLFSQGVLLAYAFTAVNRVSSGNLKNYMPEIGNISDLAEPARLGFAALLISAGPLLALSYFHANPFAFGGGAEGAPIAVVAAQDAPPSSAERAFGDAGKDQRASPAAVAGRAAGSRAWVGLLFVLALAWYVLYAPIALAVAAISRSFLTTINPLVGLDSISKMGSVYWQAMAVYAALTLAQWLFGLLASPIPLAGTLAKAFADSYANLAIGCTLGLAVFKRSRELGFE